MRRGKAYILGAGVSGLVTGWKLAEKGWDIEIIEKEPHIAGMARTWKWLDFLVDVGPHIYHTPDEKMAEFWEREFGDLLIKKDLWCKTVIGEKYDQYYDYPLSRESLETYPSPLKEKILHELAHIRSEDKNSARSYKEYIVALVGPTLQQMFFEEYPRKLWGLPTEDMTATWAPKRIELRERRAPFYTGQYSAVGRYGTGCVYDRIYEKILQLGGRVRLSRGLQKLDYTDTTIKGLQLFGGEGIELRPQDILVSTIPINVLCRFLGIPSSLTFRGITSVYLAFNREYILPETDHFLYFGSPKLLFNRLSEQKRISEDTAPKGKTCLTAEIAYTIGDEIHKMSEDELCKTVLKQVCAVGLAHEEECYAASVHRQPFVYPLLHRDYQHELAAAQSRLGAFKQLYSIGTTGEFNYADSQILFLKAFDLVELLTNQFSELNQYARKHFVTTPNPVVSLNGKSVGDGFRPYLIAEAGLNHNGSLDLALALVDKAHEAGCDAIKFQTYSSGDRISSKVKKVRYAETTIGTEETLLEMFKRLELSLEDHKTVFAHARAKGIEVFSTPFDPESADLLESLGVSCYKIASFDLVNLPLLSHVAAKGKPMILSTGMSELGQVEEAVDAVRSEGNSNIILLHCISCYPAAPEQMNLNVIGTLKRSFRVPVGLSDHTLGTMVSQIALGLGANMIERHFTLSRTLEGPDHVLSSEPDEMRQLARCAGLIEGILGDGVKRIDAAEYDMINTQRKSLYAKVTILEGEVVKRGMVSIKGPALGLQPKYLDVVVGRKARRQIEADHPITWDDI